MAEQSIEERLTNLERKMAEIETERKADSLAQRTQLRELAALRIDAKELKVRYQAHEEYITDRLNEFEGRVNARFQELRDGLLALQTGQEQIIAILTGKAPRND